MDTPRIPDWRLLPHTFAERASGGEWVAADHLVHISEKIAEAVVTGSGRIIVNMPPGMGKSQFISHWTPAWFLDNFPRRNVIACSWGEDLSILAGGWVKNQAATNPHFRFKLAPDSKRKGQWNTSQGGGMKVAGVGGGITGFRGNLLIVDDPYKDMQQAESHAYRRKVESWWESTVMKRLEPGATVIVLHHRWHCQDLTGYLLKQPGWTHICLPQIARAGDALGRAPGAVLWPGRFSTHEVYARRAVAEELSWAALEDQDPRETVSGAVYGNYSGENNRADVTHDLTRWVGLTLDFNINPGMHGLLGQVDPLADRVTIFREFHSHRLSLEGLLGEFWRWYEPLRIKPPEVRIYGDATKTTSTHTGRTAWDLVAGWFRDKGIRHRLMVGASNPPVVDRVRTVNDALRDMGGTRHLFINGEACPRLIADMREQRTDTNGHPDESNPLLGHSGAACGYMLCVVRPAGVPKTPRVGGRFVFSRQG